MTQKKFVFRQPSGYICTRRIQFLLQNFHVYLFQILMALFAALLAGAKTYLLCNFFNFPFQCSTERLGGCLYKCGCVVKILSLNVNNT